MLKQLVNQDAAWIFSVRYDPENGLWMKEGVWCTLRLSNQGWFLTARHHTSIEVSQILKYVWYVVQELGVWLVVDIMSRFELHYLRNKLYLDSDNRSVPITKWMTARIIWIQIFWFNLSRNGNIRYGNKITTDDRYVTTKLKIP